MLPVPLTVASQIENYLTVRKRCTNNTNFILAGLNDNPLSTRHIYPAFHQAVKETGLASSRRIIGNTTFSTPTPHSLRHSFAVNTLKDVKSRGGCPQKALPVLSAYMGHRKYRYTALYLKVLDAEQRQGLVDFSIAHQEDL